MLAAGSASTRRPGAEQVRRSTRVRSRPRGRPDLVFAERLGQARMAREGRRKHVVGIMAAREDHRDAPPLQLLGHGKDQLAAQVHVQQRAVQGLLLRQPQRLVELRHRARPARNRDRRALAPAPWRRTDCPPPSGPGAASWPFLLPSPDAHSGRRCAISRIMPSISIRGTGYASPGRSGRRFIRAAETCAGVHRREIRHTIPAAKAGQRRCSVQAVCGRR